MVTQMQRTSAEPIQGGRRIRRTPERIHVSCLEQRSLARGQKPWSRRQEVSGLTFGSMVPAACLGWTRSDASVPQGGSRGVGL